MSMKAIAITIKTASGCRYFRGWGAKGRVQTAWHIAAAKLFSEGSGQLEIVTAALKAKKKRFEIVEVKEVREVIDGLKLDLLSAYGDGWFDAFLAAQRAVRRDGDLEGYSEHAVLELSEIAESECKLVSEEKMTTEAPCSPWAFSSSLTMKFIGRETAQVARGWEYKHIDALHECIANEDIESAKRLMADFVANEIPF